jgi:hypothetical protein
MKSCCLISLRSVCLDHTLDSRVLLRISKQGLDIPISIQVHERRTKDPIEPGGNIHRSRASVIGCVVYARLSEPHHLH